MTPKVTTIHQGQGAQAERTPRLRTLDLVDNRFALIVDRIPEGWKRENLEALKAFAAEVGAAGVLVYWDEIALPDDEP